MRSQAASRRKSAHPAAAGANADAILTPDRRLRVFVSSSLRELAEEREAIRRAIDSLRLTPILFELGARPHPPATLYRAYLAQSEIFVGIYWESGGWIAPGARTSGIEDEYGLATRLPRLIYVKEPAPNREPRLAALLDRIRADADASYRAFQSIDELSRLVCDDIALLITERFTAFAVPAVRTGPARARSAGNLPEPAAPLIDRSDELALLKAFLRDDHIRLTALTGPGGVGKTRLAVEAAAARKGDFRDGAWMVPLASVREAGLVPSAILDALGVTAGGRRPIDALKGHLRAREHLLLLDNFEQTLAAAPLLAELIEAVPGVKFLVTSRSSLHLRAEHELPISPLAVPAERAGVPAALKAPAVQLFLDRARAVRPTLESDPRDVAAVAEIVRRFDGLPLAIELAASRCRLMSPSELLARLTAALDLGGELRDLPDRQRTLRSAIRWSFDLLEDRERSLFLRLSVFRRGFTVESAEAICPDLRGGAFLDALEALVDSSLIERRWEDRRSRYYMLEIVGEFADEQLVEAGLADEARAEHASFMSELLTSLSPDIFGPGQRRAEREIDREYPNIAAAMDWYLEKRDIERLAQMTWACWPYWWFCGRFAEGGERARKGLDAGPCSDLAQARLTGTVGILAVWRADEVNAMTYLQRSLELFRRVQDGPSVAQILLVMAVAAWGADPKLAAQLLDECRPLFRANGDTWGLATAANVAAWLSPPIGPDGKPTPYTKQALALSQESGDDLNVGMALGNLAAQESQLGLLQDAREHLAAGIELLAGAGDRYVLTATLVTLARVASQNGDPAVGAELLGAAQGLRDWLMVPLQPHQADQYAQLLDAARSEMDPDEFQRRFDDGKDLEYDAAVALALRTARARPLATSA